jgi:hypothetical protein
MLNCVFDNKSGVCCRICVVCRESGVGCRIVYSIVNQVLATELCSPQRIRCSLPNCVVRRESSVRCRLGVARSELGFCYRIVYSTAIQVFVVESVLSAVNQVFAAELCYP